MPRFTKSIFIIIPAIFAAYFLINGAIQNNPIDGQPAIAAGDEQRPRVFLSGENNQYGWGGVVSLSAADEPSIIIDSYNISGTADVDIYQAKADDLLSFLTHDEKNIVVRSGIGIVVKESEKEFIFWAQDFKTKRSVGGGFVKLYNLLNGKKVISEAKFDKDGIAKVSLSSGADIAIFEKDGTI